MPALYSDILLDHFRHPRNYGSLDAPDISNEQFNPLCGDRIRLELRLERSVQAEGRFVVAEVRFKGDACAISTAAASLLTEMVLGEDIKSLADLPDAQLISALASDIKPARLQCARLPLQALREGLQAYNLHRR